MVKNIFLHILTFIILFMLSIKIGNAKNTFENNLKEEINKINDSIVTIKNELIFINDDIIVLEKKQKIALQKLKNNYLEYIKIKSILKSSAVNPYSSFFLYMDRPKESLLAYSLLKRISKDVEKKMNVIKIEIANLKKINKQILQRKIEVKKNNESLKTKSNNLKEKINKMSIKNPSFLISRTNHNNINVIIKEIVTLEEIISEFIDNDIKTNIETTPNNKKLIKNKEKIVNTNAYNIFSKNSNILYPVKGRVMEKFGYVGKNKLPRVNLKLKTLENEKIRAPFDGEIAYISKIRNNNNRIMIIKHKGNYYSIISGAINISVKENQWVKKNQKIGNVLNNADSITYELRKKTKTIDPNIYLSARN